MTPKRMYNPIKAAARLDPALWRAVEISAYTIAACLLGVLLGRIPLDAEGAKTVAIISIAPILAYVAKKKRDLEAKAKDLEMYGKREETPRSNR